MCNRLIKRTETMKIQMCGESAADALGNIKSDTAVQLLINALKDEDSVCADGGRQGHLEISSQIQLCSR